MIRYWAAALALVIPLEAARATTNMSRKYSVSCGACHTRASMPRLNFYGEQFEHNGYQLVGEMDGDEVGKTRVKNTLFDEFANLVAIRLQATPVRYTTNVVNDRTGQVSDQVNLGLIDNLNPFVAGSVMKNISFYLNVEFAPKVDSKGISGIEIDYKQFYLGWHNIFGTSWLNLRIGKQPPMAVTANTARAPMFPGIDIGQVFQVRSSRGKGDDSTNARSGRPALSVYGHGHLGSLLYAAYSVGVDQGREFFDPNRAKNFYGSVVLGVGHGLFEGTNLSVFGSLGTDTKEVLGPTGGFLGRNVNQYRRLIFSANLRIIEIDLVASLLLADESNLLLAPSNQAIVGGYHGITVMAGYPLSDKWHVGAQYDWVNSTDPEMEQFLFQKISPAVSFNPIDNIRIMLMLRVDLLRLTSKHPYRQHELFLTGRAMF